jgi:hypothetical protein
MTLEARVAAKSFTDAARRVNFPRLLWLISTNESIRGAVVEFYELLRDMASEIQEFTPGENIQIYTPLPALKDEDTHATSARAVQEATPRPSQEATPKPSPKGKLYVRGQHEEGLKMPGEDVVQSTQEMQDRIAVQERLQKVADITEANRHQLARRFIACIEPFLEDEEMKDILTDMIDKFSSALSSTGKMKRPISADEQMLQKAGEDFRVCNSYYSIFWKIWQAGIR